MPRVQVPNEFFKKERQQLYANWPGAFWRELTQNAIDAGSSEVLIDLEQCDGYVRVRFADDGPGMDREVLQKVYFCLGETTKGGPHDIMRLGGFGRARILTCFSMRAYEIRTQNSLVRGMGANYTIKNLDPVIDGCHLTIDIDDATLLTLDRALRLFLRHSQIGARMVVNGTVWTEWAPRGSVVTALKHDNIAFATVYSQEAGLLNHVIVRCRGLQSYFQMSRVPLQVVIEIVPQMARTVLTGNRDGMLVEYSRVVDQFLEDMTLNTSMLTPQRLRRFEPERAKQFFTANLEAGPEMADDISNYVWLFDEIGDGKSVAAYRPTTWTTSRQTMMNIWRIVCDEAVNAMIEASQTPEFNWAIGWYFGNPSIEAVTKRDFSDDHIHIFCINPIDRSGKFWFATDDWKYHFRRMVALAAHEVTHGKHFSHDERFALLFTEIIAVFQYQRCLDAIDNLFTGDSDKARNKALQRPLGPNHATILGIMIDNETQYPDGMSHADVQHYWPYKLAAGAQEPVHGRFSDLVKTETWGEELVRLVGLKPGPTKNRQVTAYKITEAGRRRYDNRPVILPELTEEEEVLFSQVMDSLPTQLNATGREFYRAVFRAGSAGITFYELAKTSYAAEVMERENWDVATFEHNISSRHAHIRGFHLIDDAETTPTRRGKVLRAIARLERAGV